MAKSADRYFQLDSDIIQEIGYNPAYSLESESIFSLANEHMGVRGYFEEGSNDHSLRGCYLGGVYEKQPHTPESHYLGFVHQTHYMTTAADCLRTQLSVEGETLNLSECEFSDYTRTLRFADGVLTRSFCWHTKAAGRIQVSFERLVSMAHPQLMAQRIALQALDGAADVALEMAVDGNNMHQTSGTCLWKETENVDNQLTLTTATTGISARYTLFTKCPGTQTMVRRHRLLVKKFGFKLAAQKMVCAQRIVCVDTAHPGESLPPVTEPLDFDVLQQENRECWSKFWQSCDVRIDGDIENQQGIRYCLFQLHSTYRGLDPRNNIGAKGLTGEAYSGHAFWDTETYGLPFYLFNDPQAAKTLLLYRYTTLPQALERARELGLDGACYPIATLDGTEACTLWQHSSLQMQPSTSVAYAIEKYVNVTGDTQFLYTEGAEMLVQVARYVFSRGGWNDQGFGFYGVMGPDEFHMMVSNDFYTNFMGKKSLQLAVDVVQALDDEHRAALIAKTGLKDQEAEEWRKAAEAMIFIRREDGVFEQHEGFFNLPHIDVRQIPQEEFPLYAHWSYDRIYRTDMIKQPDVLMAILLYGDDFTPEEKAANYAYYEPRCIHESSLSPSIHAILAAELGRHAETLSFFAFATRLDLDNYNRNTHEGLHLSSVAAAWMTIVQGFGGVRYENGKLSLNPWLPKQWQRFSFSLQIRASVLRIDVSTHGVAIACEGEPIPVVLYGKEILPQAQSLNYPPEAIQHA